MPRLVEIKPRDEKIRTVTVPGPTLEREKSLRSNYTSIRERNCRRQIDKIGGDRMGIFSHILWNGYIPEPRLSSTAAETVGDGRRRRNGRSCMWQDGRAALPP